MGSACFRPQAQEELFDPAILEMAHQQQHRYRYQQKEMEIMDHQIQGDLVRDLSNDGSSTAAMDILRMSSSAGGEEDSGDCAICYDELCKAPVSVLCNAQGHRVCRHYYHTKCCEMIEGACGRGGPDAQLQRSCPLCRRSFHRAVAVPSVMENPLQWFKVVDSDGSMDLDKTEVVEALVAVFPIDSKAMEQNLEQLWDRWDKTKSGSITLPEFVDKDQGLLNWVLKNQHRIQKKAVSLGIPEIRTNRRAWFEYWDADGNGELDREEVLRALLKTFRGADVGVTRSLVQALWRDFDTDNGGTIDHDEFMRPGIGLLDTILANLQLPH